MNLAFCLVLAVLSVWDYPARQPRHEELRRQFVTAVREQDVETKLETCEKGVALLPDDPTWRYNLACAQALGKDPTAALDTLEKAIDLGFRDADVIAADADFKALAGKPRFKELVDYARDLHGRPILSGPLATVTAVGVAGESMSLGAQNLGWNLETGCFEAKMRLETASEAPFAGDLYVNRDARHSMLVVTNYPGLTAVTFDREGRERGMDVNLPNTLYPYPVFGNCSRAFVQGPFWRSMPRSAMTGESGRMKAFSRFYLSNQIWVLPAVYDYAFGTTNAYGDVFASVAPYWFVTQGRSWSDRPYLQALLDATKAMDPAVKQEVVRRGLLAPTLQALLRKTLKGVSDEAAYLTPKAHPTAFPPGGYDLRRLRRAAAALRVETIPPVATVVGVLGDPVLEPSLHPELTYASPCSWAFVLRSPDTLRSFTVKAAGGAEFAFATVHDDLGAATVKKLSRDSARIDLDRLKMSVTNRVDLAVFARNPGTGWGAPSFVSFAVVDPSAPYSDPLLTPLPPPASE